MSRPPLLAALAVLALLSPAQAQETPNHWPALARTDLDFIYRNLQQNHPGAIDTQFALDWRQIRGVRGVDLPSGLGTLALAQKVYRGRARANNQAYVPQLPYRGRIGDTAPLQAWVLQQDKHWPHPEAINATTAH